MLRNSRYITPTWIYSKSWLFPDGLGGLNFPVVDSLQFRSTKWGLVSVTMSLRGNDAGVDMVAARDEEMRTLHSGRHAPSCP